MYSVQCTVYSVSETVKNPRGWVQKLFSYQWLRVLTLFSEGFVMAHTAPNEQFELPRDFLRAKSSLQSEGRQPQNVCIQGICPVL